MFIILTITISFLSSLLITNLYLKLATRLKLYSKPHDGSIIPHPNPTSAGIAFALLYCLIIIALDQYLDIANSFKQAIFLCAFVMAILGFLDDLFGLSSKLRICIQFSFVFLVGYLFEVNNLIYEGNDFVVIFLALVGLLSSIWLINTFNFMDGADGLVSTNSFLFSLLGGLYFYLAQEIELAICLWALSSINLSFLFFNWAPAKLFMGDSGSLFLGSIFVVFSLGSIINNQISPYVWLILFSIFYVETTVTLIVRIFRKRNVFKEHHSLHAYQRQIINSGDHSRPAKLSIIIQLFWTAPLSFLCFTYPEYGWGITFLTVLPLICIFYFFGPYQVDPDS